MKKLYYISFAIMVLNYIASLAALIWLTVGLAIYLILSAILLTIWFLVLEDKLIWKS